MSPPRVDRITTALAHRMSRRTSLQASGLGLVGAVLGAAASSTLAQDASPIASPMDGCPASSEVDNLATASRWFTEVINQRKLDVLDEILASDVAFYPPTFEDSLGPESVKASIGTLLDAYSAIEYTIDQMLTQDDDVVIAWSGVGTQQGDFAGFPPSGDERQWTGMHFFRFGCGQIAEIWVQADVLAQVGLVEAAADLSPSMATPSVLTGACQDPTPEEVTGIIERWQDVWNSHDLATYEGLVHPDAVHHFGVRPDAVGLPAIEESLAGFFEAFSDLQNTLDYIVVDGPLAALRYTSTGTQDGSFFGSEPTGKSATWTGMSIVRISCGQVIESWGEVDGMALWQQLGLLEEQGTPVT